MRNIPTGWLMIGSLAVITIGFVPIGFSISALLNQGAVIRLSFLVLVSMGTLLALVRGIGSLFPAVVINAFIFQRLGLGALVVSAMVTTGVVALAMLRTDDDPKEDRRQIVAYELLGGVCIGLFGFYALQGLMDVVSVRLLPIVGGLFGGFLSIFSEMSNFVGLKQKQLVKLVCTLAMLGITIGLLVQRLLPQGGAPN